VADQPKLGSGGRFAALVASGKSPALAAWIGRRRYGAKKMAHLAAAGAKRAANDAQKPSY